jgi:endonuclease YncB( thermonuclease family)
MTTASALTFKLRLFALVAFAIALSCTAQARNQQSLDVKVVGITDGDTLKVVDARGQQHRIRLSGIDAPEKKQPFGEKSRQSLAALAFGKPARIEWSQTDKYGRLLAKVLVASPGCASPCTTRIDVNLAQLNAGMAWYYRYFERQQPQADRLTYSAAEAQARERKLGLWSQPRPVAPWDWRQRQGEESARRRAHTPASPRR